jgi:hypothetical protein
MSSSNQASNIESNTLPKYSETASLAPSYKSHDPALPQKREISETERLEMLEEFRREKEAGSDYQDWHIGAGAPGTGHGGEPSAGTSKLIDRVSHLMGGSKSKGVKNMDSQK